jgi:hypothetical protein
MSKGEKELLPDYLGRWSCLRLDYLRDLESWWHTIRVLQQPATALPTKSLCKRRGTVPAPTTQNVAALFNHVVGAALICRCVAQGGVNMRCMTILVVWLAMVAEVQAHDCFLMAKPFRPVAGERPLSPLVRGCPSTQRKPEAFPGFLRRVRQYRSARCTLDCVRLGTTVDRN